MFIGRDGAETQKTEDASISRARSAHVDSDDLVRCPYPIAPAKSPRAVWHAVAIRPDRGSYFQRGLDIAFCNVREQKQFRWEDPGTMAVEALLMLIGVFVVLALGSRWLFNR